MSLLRRQPLLTIWLIVYGMGPVFGKAGSFALALARGHGEPDLRPASILFGYALWILPASLITGLTYALYRARGSIPLAPLLVAGGVLSYAAMLFSNALAAPIDFDFLHAITNSLVIHLSAILGCWVILKTLTRAC